MCPDRQIISLYHDKELSSPWKEKMKAHLETCPKCRAAFSGYSRLGELLREPSAGGVTEIRAMEAARERVWNKLSEPAFSGPAARAPSRENRFWYKKVTLPLPAAAAAAVLLVVAAAVFLRINGPAVPVLYDSMAAVPIGIDAEDTILPVNDMNDVLKYLSNQDSGGDFMVIPLPKSKKFRRTGQPALINAADYSGGDFFR